MRTVVYLKDDPQRNLYFKNSVPRRVSVVKPNSTVLIEILLDKLNLLGIAEAEESLNCAISFEMPQIPVYYGKMKGIRCIYDKRSLEQWFGLGNTRDPGGLSEQAKLSDYVVAKPEDILDFVISFSKLELDFLVSDYKVQKQIIPAEEERLINTTDSEEVHGCCFAFFKRRKKEELEGTPVVRTVLE